MNRREFLGCLAAGSTLLPLGMPSLAAKTPIHERLGVQLYTVREGLSSDLRGTVEGLKEIGFKEAELCRWLDLPTTARALRDVGITPVGALFEGAIITGNWDSWEGAGVPIAVPDYGVEHAIEETLDHDLRHVGVAYIFPSEREGLDAYRALADAMNVAGEKCTAAGVRFIYHNHSFEFEPLGDLTPFDILIERLDSALVGLELDVCWASIGGVDPAQLLRDHPQFIEMIHVKDRTDAVPVMYEVQDISPESMTEVGSGTLDFRAILSAAEDAGVRHYFVEQDYVSGDVLQSLQTSVRYLHDLGL